MIGEIWDTIKAEGEESKVGDKRKADGGKESPDEVAAKKDMKKRYVSS